MKCGPRRALAPGLRRPPEEAGEELREQGTISCSLASGVAAELLAGGRPGSGLFASLTLPDVDGAIAEAEHALCEPGADGVIPLANVRSTYLGDPARTR